VQDESIREKCILRYYMCIVRRIASILFSLARFDERVNCEALVNGLIVLIETNSFTPVASCACVLFASGRIHVAMITNREKYEPSSEF